MLTIATLGLWGICLLSAAAKRWIWPWRCEHCGWHEPDFRSPAEREAAKEKPNPRAGERKRLKTTGIVPNTDFQTREGE